MIKYILGFVIVIAIVLVAILFGFGLILGWLISGFFYLKLKFKNMVLARQVKRQTLQLHELTTTRDKAV